MEIPNPILYFTFKWLSRPQMSNFLVYGLIWIIFSLSWKFDGDSKFDIVLSLKSLSDHKSPNSCLWTDLNNFFSLYWKLDGDSKNWYCTFPQMTQWTTKVQFFVYGPIWIIFFLWLENLMGIPNSILFFPKMTVLTTSVQFRCFLICKSWLVTLYM